MKVVYFSSTGNTEAMARMLEEELGKVGVSAELVEVSDASASDLEGEDVFALGCPAMGDEELDDDMESLEQEVEKFAAGKKIGLFGSYDWGEGDWMRTWEGRLTDAGATVVGTVIANLEPDDQAQADLAELAKKLV